MRIVFSFLIESKIHSALSLKVGLRQTYIIGGEAIDRGMERQLHLLFIDCLKRFHIFTHVSFAHHTQLYITYISSACHV